MITFKKLSNATLAFVLFVATYLACFIGTQSAYAATNETYTNVLNDMQKDTSFNIDAYPVKSDDYSLQLIQLAEGKNGELFVYVYQPSGKEKDLRASSINISDGKKNIVPFASSTEEIPVNYSNYKLTLCNSYSTLYKYVVNSYTVDTSVTPRYYEITSIYRPFDSTIDTQADHDNTITYVPYPVSKRFCFFDEIGETHCSSVDIETIRVTDKFVGFCRYSNGFQLCPTKCDSHFVAFNTDKPIDKLLEAKVYYTTSDYRWSLTPGYGESETFGEPLSDEVYLTHKRVIHKGSGIGAETYEWDRIETVEQFKSENNYTNSVYTGVILEKYKGRVLSEEDKKALEGKKWVLRFLETDYRLEGLPGGATQSSSTLVGDVTILELKFQTNGKEYHLGVIDNMQTGSRNPVGHDTSGCRLSTSGKIILSILALIAIVYLVARLYKATKSTKDTNDTKN